MFVTNVFSEDELEKIHADLNNQLVKGGWHTWSRAKLNVADASGTKNTTEYPHEQGEITFKYINGDIKDIIRQKLIQIDPNIRGYDFTAFYQIWDIGAATGLHDDSRYMFNATFYLNKDWHLDDGGLYVYQDGEECKVFFPEYNSCGLINKSKVEPHLVTPVTTNAREKRYTIHCKGIIQD